MKKIAVIGAGLAGLVVAKNLKEYNEITIFEKSRGVGGRIATRYANEFHFDHGAQFFHAKTSEFEKFLQPLLKDNVIQLWKARFREYDGPTVINERIWDDKPAHYVGIPNMNSIGKYLAKNLNVKLLTRVEKLIPSNNKWKIFDDANNDLGDFDWVIVTTPSPQTIKLLPSNISFYNNLLDKKMLACFSLMLGFSQPIDLGFDAALVKNADISWISINSSKPKRNQHTTTLLIHSTNAYATEHIDNAKEPITQHLLTTTSEIIGKDLKKANHVAIHGWRYANIGKQSGSSYLLDKTNKLAVCGDSLIRGRIESAFTSANNLTKELKKVISL